MEMVWLGRFALLFLFPFLTLAKHHVCLLGLSGTTSKTIMISRGMIESISKIDSYVTFNVLTRHLQRGNQSYSHLNGVSITHGSMFNLTDIQSACQDADVAIFTVPISNQFTRLEMIEIILTGLELAHVKYFIYCSGSLDIPNSYHHVDELHQYLHKQVMEYRFKDYAMISTGGWMELYFSKDTVSFLSTLPIFFGISFPSPHPYTSMTDIGPVTALVLYKIIYPGRYKVSTHHRVFEIYDPQPYSSSKLALLLSSITQRKMIINAGAGIPYLLSTLSPVFQFLHLERLTYLSSLFGHYLSHQNTPVNSKGYLHTVGILGYTPTTVDQYFRGILLGEVKVQKISGTQAKANQIRKEDMNEGMKKKLERKSKKGEL
jgi:hypothetical protein